MTSACCLSVYRPLNFVMFNDATYVNGSDVYSGGTRFESGPGYRLPLPQFFVAFFSTSKKNYEIILRQVIIFFFYIPPPFIIITQRLDDI
jgi:hypothetical protein